MLRKTATPAAAADALVLATAAIGMVSAYQLVRLPAITMKLPG